MTEEMGCVDCYECQKCFEAQGGCARCFSCQKCFDKQTGCEACFSCEKCFGCESGITGESAQPSRDRPQRREDCPQHRQRSQPLTAADVQEIVTEVLITAGLLTEKDRKGIDI